MAVTFLDGHRVRHPLGDLGDSVTESAKPSNVRAVQTVAVALDSPALSDGLQQVVDTPGAGSVFAHTSATAERGRVLTYLHTAAAHAGVDALGSGRRL